MDLQAFASQSLAALWIGAVRSRVRLLILPVALSLGACNTIDRLTEAPPEPMPALPEMPASAPGTISYAGGGMALFEDTRAHNVGDLLTIQLVESTTAKKSATTNTSKDDSVAIGATSVMGYNLKTDSSVSNKRAFAGAGDSAQSNTLTGSVTVMVVQRLANGNLLVRGEKQLQLNQGSEYVRIEGIVRPVDIATDNTIQSSRVGNARVAYAGRGALADANAQGWLTRFFNSPWIPF